MVMLCERRMWKCVVTTMCVCREAWCKRQPKRNSNRNAKQGNGRWPELQPSQAAEKTWPEGPNKAEDRDGNQLTADRQQRLNTIGAAKLARERPEWPGSRREWPEWPDSSQSVRSERTVVGAAKLAGQQLERMAAKMAKERPDGAMAETRAG